MPNLNTLFKQNEQWASAMVENDPDYFAKLAKAQTPEFLWIGCADSRVPATQITNMGPGSIFVHRNVANLVIHTDVNMLSAVYYAITALKVKHILVCGHYGCGGVQAAMTNQSHGFIDNWLTHIRDVYEKHSHELDKIEDLKKRSDRLVELNVYEQVHNLAKVSFIQEQWENSRYPYIHGIVYGLETGKLKNLNITINSLKQTKQVFHLRSNYA